MNTDDAHDRDRIASTTSRAVLLSAALLALPQATSARMSQECPAEPPLNGDQVLIGYNTNVFETYQISGSRKAVHTRIGKFRPAAIIHGTTIQASPGGAIHDGQRFWPVMGGGKPITLTRAGSFLDLTGDDHCVYFGTPTGAKYRRWTLFSSQPLPGVFRAPTPSDRALYRALDNTCVFQEEKPPCVRPALLAVSDVNHNGLPEYWVAMPYVWDRGLSVYELKGSLAPILAVCPGCGD